MRCQFESDGIRENYLAALEDSCKPEGKGKQVDFKVAGSAWSAGGSLWHNFCKSVPQQLGNMVRGFRTQLKYQRPSGAALHSSGLMELLEEVWDDDLSGWKKKTGFGLLYEMLTGRLNLQITQADFDRTEDEIRRGVDEKKQPAAEAIKIYLCPSCTVENPIEAAKCSVCGADNPNIKKADRKSTRLNSSHT